MLFPYHLSNQQANRYASSSHWSWFSSLLSSPLLSSIYPGILPHSVWFSNPVFRRADSAQHPASPHHFHKANGQWKLYEQEHQVKQTIIHSSSTVRDTVLVPSSTFQMSNLHLNSNTLTSKTVLELNSGVIKAHCSKTTARHKIDSVHYLPWPEMQKGTEAPPHQERGSQIPEPFFESPRVQAWPGFKLFPVDF